MTTLLDNAPPGTEELQEDEKGEGLLAVYREDITAVLTPLIQTPADLTFIRSLEDYLLRIAVNFCWAYKVPSYLSKFDALTRDKKAQLRNDLNKMIRLKTLDYEAALYLCRGLGILVSVLFGQN